MSHMHNPIWFLVLSLFVPRIALLVGWLDGWYFGIGEPAEALLWIFLPRVLVLISIYYVQGIGLWFVLHLLVALITWTGSTGAVSRRRTRRRAERRDYIE